MTIHKSMYKVPTNAPKPEIQIPHTMPLVHIAYHLNSSINTRFMHLGKALMC